MKQIKITETEMSEARTYRVSGNKVIGYRLIIPNKALKLEKPISAVWRCIVKKDGTLIYRPVHP